MPLKSPPHLCQFILDDDLAPLVRDLPQLVGVERVDALVALAWHLRQRNCARALELAQEALELLPKSGVAAPEMRRHTARLYLVQGEVKMLFAALEEAERYTQSAARIFDGLNDPLGMGDMYCLKATLGLDRGGLVDALAALELAGLQYAKTPDTDRLHACIARYLSYDAFRDAAAASLKIRAQFPPNFSCPAGVRAWVASAQANAAVLTDEMAHATGYFLESFEASMLSGQVRQAMVVVGNAGESFSKLGDLDAALAWCERAMPVAHAAGWPTSVGMTLMQAGSVMRLLGRYEESRKYLQDALAVLQNLPQSRNYELVLGGLGELELDTAHFAEALHWFSQLEDKVKAHMEPDQVIMAWRGQASSLSALGQPEEALAKAAQALDLAHQYGNTEAQVQVLRAFAQTHLSHLLPAPPGMTAPTPALHYLQLAMEVAESIDGYALPPDLLQQRANAFAANGDYQAAFEQSQLCAAARERVHAQETQKRAQAVQIQSQVQRAQAEAEHHRQLAASLRETASTLEVLGTIGREVTGSLNAQAVFEALHRHVDALLDAASFGVYLIDANQETMTSAFGREYGVDLPKRTINLDSPTSRFARCARERQELVFDLEDDSPEHLIPGTLMTHSLMYAPLIVGEHILGVMTIQSPERHAYGEREQSIFRSLCAYGAIALDNSRAYAAAEQAQRTADQALADLRQTQVQLLSQNDMLKRLSVTDLLTGLSNRLKLDETLQEEYRRHSRHGREDASFGVLLIDVDHFKAVNDTHGHQVGDAVLLGIARTMAHSVREVDVLGRWGGEEFLVICREIRIDGAMALAEKLRLAVQAQAFETVGHKTISVGAAVFHSGEQVTDTIARADAALYRAKHSGRNCVMSGEAETPSLFDSL